MLEPLRPIRTVIPLLTSQRRAVKSAPGAVGQAPEAKGEGSSSAGVSGGIVLHSDIPAELLNIPQIMIGRTTAFVAYLSNQTSNEADTGSGEEAGQGAVSSKEADGVIDAKEENGIWIAENFSPAKSTPTGIAKGAVRSPFRAKKEEPVCVPPEPASETTPQTSKVKSFGFNIGERVKDAYYKMMTMVPYSVGMLINVFA